MTNQSTQTTDSSKVLRVGKKMTLTEQEKNDIELGTISSYKKTPTYLRASSFFKTECARIISEKNVIDQEKTQCWFEEETWSIKMLFVYEESSVQKPLQNFEDIIERFKKIFDFFSDDKKRKKTG